jgi:CDP-diacylglycerol---serine O-phosphatidyltransferase
MSKAKQMAKPLSLDSSLFHVQIKHILPNAVTILALCSGMTALILAADERYSAAIACVFLAAILDACDGRVARATGGASKFGAELDSLADVVCFGAVPSFIVYMALLKPFGTMGWVACMMLQAACALRLARFNVAVNDPNKPSWSPAFFQGVPAPAGAFLALLPVYFVNANMVSIENAQRLAVLWLPLVAFLMFSTLPTFSGKLVGRVMVRAWVLLLIGAAGIAAVVLTQGVWTGLVVAVIGYFAVLPLSVWRHRVLTSRSSSIETLAA